MRDEPSLIHLSVKGPETHGSPVPVWYVRLFVRLLQRLLCQRVIHCRSLNVTPRRNLLTKTFGPYPTCRGLSVLKFIATRGPFLQQGKSQTRIRSTNIDPLLEWYHYYIEIVERSPQSDEIFVSFFRNLSLRNLYVIKSILKSGTKQI